jgi:hypothetical protein
MFGRFQSLAQTIGNAINITTTDNGDVVIEAAVIPTHQINVTVNQSNANADIISEVVAPSNLEGTDNDDENADNDDNHANDDDDDVDDDDVEDLLMDYNPDDDGVAKKNNIEQRLIIGKFSSHMRQRYILKFPR